MVKRGYDVEQNPDVPGPKEPDYKIEGEVFDCYSPEPDTSPRNVASGVGKKIKKQQTERVVVNLQDWQGDVGTLDKQMSDWPIEGLKEMMVVDKSGNIFHIFPENHLSLECSLVVACPLNPVQLMTRALEWENISPAPEILPNGVLVLDLRSQGFVIRADAGTS